MAREGNYRYLTEGLWVVKLTKIGCPIGDVFKLIQRTFEPRTLISAISYIYLGGDYDT